MHVTLYTIVLAGKWFLRRGLLTDIILDKNTNTSEISIRHLLHKLEK